LRSKQRFDLAFGFPRRGREKLCVIFIGQSFVQELERRQVHGAGCEQRTDDWKAPTEACGENAAKRFALAQPKRVSVM
jgi:hypothetical protein